MNEWKDGEDRPCQQIQESVLIVIGPTAVWRNHPCGLWPEIKRVRVGYLFPFCDFACLSASLSPHPIGS